MSERLIVIDWYTGASLFYTVYSEVGATLQARTAMSESPSGSGCFVHSNSVWDDSWAGRLVFDDGVLFESRAGNGTPPTVRAIAAAVLDEAIGTHTGLLAGVALEATLRSLGVINPIRQDQ